MILATCSFYVETETSIETTEGDTQQSWLDSFFGVSDSCPVYPVNDLDLDKFMGEWH